MRVASKNVANWHADGAAFVDSLTSRGVCAAAAQELRLTEQSVPGALFGLRRAGWNGAFVPI
eukprot:15193464-Alexandrium_andersonii.AAC.1